MEELATVIIVTYNSRHYLDACLNSVLSQDYPHEVMIVDNCSADGTVEYVRNAFPQVKVIECPENRGYGAGNNLGVRHAKGEYIVILNPDVIVEKGWLRELVAPLRGNPKNITTPKILVYDGSKINTCGNINTIIGLTFTRGLGADPAHYMHSEEVTGISGACFAMSRDEYLRLGGFDENFFLYNEDSELSWRAHLYGYTVLFVPTSIVKHDYKLNVSAEKLYFLEKGRYMILRKYFSSRDAFLFSPSLIVAEVLTLGYSFRLGWKGITAKYNAIRDGFGANIEKMAGNRVRVLPHLCPTIPEDQLTYNEMEKFGKIISNRIFEWNYRALSRVYSLL